MTSFIRTAVVAAAAMLALSAQAQVTVSEAWVRATVPGQQATGAFMQLKAAKDSKLLAVATPLTPNAEIHEMAMQGDVMKMRAVPFVALPAGQTVALKSGGHHIMLMALKQQVKAGDSVALTLTVEGADGKRETLEVKAPVRALNATQPAAAPAHAHGDHGDKHDPAHHHGDGHKH